MRDAALLTHVMTATNTIREASTFTWCITSLVVLHVVGGAVFSWLERDAELNRYRQNRSFFEQMRELYEFDKCKDEWFRDMEFCKKQKEFDEMLKRFLERSGHEMKDHSRFTFLGSMFFVSTLVTTLGYGNFHPKTTAGQVFTVAFGLVGIPIMGYALSHTGRMIVQVWMPMCKRMETKNKRILVLCCLMIAFILLGGCIYRFLEGWSFLEGSYFSAMTLMSIGFGDYLPSTLVSRAVTMVFILLGLGVAAAFIALLQIHLEISGVRVASRISSWYGTLTSRNQEA